MRFLHMLYESVSSDLFFMYIFLGFDYLRIIMHTSQGSRSISKIWSPTDYMTSEKWSPNHFFVSPVLALGL